MVAIFVVTSIRVVGFSAEQKTTQMTVDSSRVPRYYTRKLNLCEHPVPYKCNFRDRQNIGDELSGGIDGIIFDFDFEFVFGEAVLSDQLSTPFKIKKKQKFGRKKSRTPTFVILIQG